MPSEVVIHGSAALVDNPIGSLNGNVKDIIRDPKGATIKQVGGGDHYYNGFFLPIPVAIYKGMDYPAEASKVERISISLKATEGTWIEWLHVHNGQEIVGNFAYGSQYKGKGNTIDNAAAILISQNMRKFAPVNGLSIFFPAGFPDSKMGEVCLQKVSVSITDVTLEG